MSSAYAVCLIAIVFHLIGVPALIYAARTRQGRGTDQEAYRLVQTSTLKAPRRGAARPVSRVHLWLFFGLLITMLVSMCGAQVYLAVRAAHAPYAPDDPN